MKEKKRKEGEKITLKGGRFHSKTYKIESPEIPFLIRMHQILRETINQKYPIWSEDESEVQLNDLLTLKLEKGKSNIYIDGKLFSQCKYLLLNIPKERLIMEEMEGIDSIDEAEEYLDKGLERGTSDAHISSRQEFFGHASNLQAWVEHDYDTRILHRNLAFPLLKALADAGDKRALQRFKEEIVIRANSNQRVFEYLFQEGYLEYLSKEERELITRKTKRIRISDLNLRAFPLELIPEDVEYLDLSHNQITEIPKEIGEMESLQVLYLQENQLTEIPESIGELKNLQTLSLGFNQITEIPKEIGEMKGLRELYLGYNQITEIPKEIGKMKGLQKLVLSANLISEISEKIGNLIDLEYLDLNYNQINKIPKEIGKMKSLEMLKLGSNQIKRIPKTIRGLKNLKYLDMDWNQITEIPESIGELKNLEYLDLRSNHISEIPNVISLLRNLHSLNLNENQITEIPKEIGEMEKLKMLDLRENPLKEVPSSIRDLEKQECKVYTR